MKTRKLRLTELVRFAKAPKHRRPKPKTGKALPLWGILINLCSAKSADELGREKSLAERKQGDSW